MLNEPKTIDIKQPSRILLKFLLFGKVCIVFRKHPEGIHKSSENGKTNMNTKSCFSL